MRKALLLVLLVPATELAAQDFTDATLQQLLSEEPRLLFYSFSPAMPLSVDGLKEVRDAALDLKARVVFLANPQASTQDIAALPLPRDILDAIQFQQSQRIRDLGIELHYPSLLVSDNHRIVGAPLPGFKSRTGYVTLVSDLLRLNWSETFRNSKAVDLPRHMSHFFRPLYGTDFILSGHSLPNYLLNLRTNDVFDIPNDDWGDPGASPDGQFITLLGVQGLAWFAASDILSGKPVLLLKDSGLRTYQSVGLLPNSSLYRVLGAKSSSTNPTGLILRDYAKTAREDGGASIREETAWRPVCEEQHISIPMMSKTGLYLSGSHEGTLKVFHIGEDGSQCEEVFDTGMVTGKADFSADDRYIVFVSRAENPETRGTVDAVYVADLRNAHITPVYYGPETSQLSFPGYLSEDEIAVYDHTPKQIILIERSRMIE